MVEHFGVKFGDSGCCRFWDIGWTNRQTNKQTNAGENLPPRLPLVWVTIQTYRHITPWQLN